MFGLFNKVTDLVCGMKINKKEAKFSLIHDGATNYFCSESCKEKFSNDPKKYSAKKNQAGGCCH